MPRYARRSLLLLGALAALWTGSSSAFAQGTAFTYQGRLQADGAPASGPYEMQFTLFDVLAGGTAVSPTVTLTVTVTNGLFSVEQLDFGACPACFNGAPRFLEVGVRPQGSPDPYTVLSPRQAVTAAPYAMRSTSAATADTATNAQHLEGLDAGDFIQNGTTPQTADFNISGNGTLGGNLSVAGSFSLNIVNAQTRYDLGGLRVLQNGGTDNTNLSLGLNAGDPVGGHHNTFGGAYAGRIKTSGTVNSFFGSTAGANDTTGSGNTFVGAGAGSGPCPLAPCPVPLTGNLNSFVGLNAGAATTTGSENSFFGNAVGVSNTTGSLNAFFGSAAGLSNTDGGHNSFFGAYAGWSNTVGIFNSFFGRGTGGANTTGGYNSMFGAGAGDHITTGSDNAFFGASAGNFNVTGSDNSFFGREAGLNSLVSGNSFFGRSAGRANVDGTLNSFFGSGAGQNTTQCCNSFFGAFAGAQNTTGSVNAFFGENAGAANTTGFGNAFLGQEAGYDLVTASGNTLGSLNTFLGRIAGRSNATGSSNTIVGANANVGSGALSFATALGADAVVSTSNTLVLGRGADTVVVPGNLTVVGTINGGGGSGSFIVNGTAVQPSANFNISGTGTASLFDAQTQYNLQGQRFVSTSLEQSNTFVGASAGDVGAPSGFNSFFGNSAGQFNGDGSSNSFFGSFAGAHNNNGGGNVFVGMSSGEANTSGGSNTFVGAGAGILNTLGSGNTFLGYQALGAAGATNVAAIGAQATVTQDNSLVLGSINGLNGATADTLVGIGTTAPRSKLEVADGDVFLSNAANGVILKSPNGSCWRITVGNTGSLASSAITCP